MAGPDDLGELRAPLVLGEVFGVGVARPDALEDHLVLGLVAGAARLNHLRENCGIAVFNTLK